MSYRKTFLLFFFVTVFSLTVGYSASMRFRHITNREGLKYTWVWDIMEDRYGYMWFSTMYGAYRYDGFGFEDYTFVNENDGSTARVNFVFEDASGLLWFGTNDGLYSHDRRYNRYTHYSRESTEPGYRLSSDYVSDMVQDKDGNLWIATRGGVDMLDPEGGMTSYPSHPVNVLFYDSRHCLWAGAVDGTVLRYRRETDSFAELSLPQPSRQMIQNFSEDSKNNIWIATGDRGAVRYTPRSGSFTYYSASNGVLPDNLVRAIVEDSDGSILIGGEYGIVSVNDDRGTLVCSSDIPWGINDNAIYSMLLDSNDNFWVGTFFGGVNLRYRHSSFMELILSTSEEYQADSKVVSSIISHEGGIMVSTENSGVYVVSPSGEKVRGIGGFKSDNIHAVCKDDSGNLWIGSYQGGLYMKPKGSGTFRHFLKGERSGLRSNNIYCIKQDSKGNLLVGTQYGGLGRYDYRNGVFESFPAGLPEDIFVWDILEDRSGNIWLAAYGSGIYRLSPEKDYSPELIAPDFARNFITLCELSDGRILAGAEKEGIAVVDPISLEVTSFSPLSLGLQDNTVYGILQDYEGNIWFSTNYGLCKCDASFDNLRQYTVADGLPTNRFNYNSCTEIGGRLYFGSINGVVVVDPRNEMDDDREWNIRFGRLFINNNREEIRPDGPLTEDLNSIGKLVLNHDQNSFGIEFSSNKYELYNSQKYAYMLDGLDNSWHSIGHGNRVDFVGLSPGSYTLSLCHVDGDVIQTDNPAVLHIKVKAVWWQTAAAKTALVLLVLLIAVYIVLLLFRDAKNRYELELEKQAREKDKEINELKFRFFVNISHEFKTPLSIILGLVELFRNGNVSQEQRPRYFSLIKKNADKLLTLINELLTFREIQLSELKAKKIDLNTFLGGVMGRHSWLFEEKHIDVRLSIPDNCAEMEADPGKLEKIFDNLLSNAYKHTPKDGYLSISFSKSGPDKVVINVLNSGEGISSDKLPYIFDRFFTSQSYDKYSSGVGLSYVKSLVELHSGTIAAYSEQGKYTEFSICLPQRQEKGGNVQDQNDELREYSTDIFPEPVLNMENSGPDVDNELYGQLAAETTILIVDDDNSMREMLVDYFSRSYHVLEAYSGEMAAQIVHENKVDIVISDVMLSGGMSGFELCRYLKNDIETSHIRVILTTVLSEHDYKYQGYRAGADSYVVKPFSFSLLELRVRNIIVGSFKLREMRKVSIDLSNIDIPSSNSDEQLLNKLVDVIIGHLSDFDFGVKELCWSVSMSKATLYRKLKAITGQSINEFIQNTRLKYATRLLDETDSPVSEIGYQVGFSDPYYFSRAFKKCFGVSPKQWREENAGKAEE